MSITGKWKLDLQTQIGAMVLTLDVKDESGVLTGTSDFYGSVVPIQQGKIEGEKFGYYFTAYTAYGNFNLGVDGVFTGDSISGTMTGETYVTFTGSRIVE